MAATLFTIQLAPQPMMTPMRPPVMLMRMASIRCGRMSTLLAPTLMRRPISRCAAGYGYMHDVDDADAAYHQRYAGDAGEKFGHQVGGGVQHRAELLLWRMVKSSSSLSFSLWFRRGATAVISSVALSVMSSVSADAKIPCR